MSWHFFGIASSVLTKLITVNGAAHPDIMPCVYCVWKPCDVMTYVSCCRFQIQCEEINEETVSQRPWTRTRPGNSDFFPFAFSSDYFLTLGLSS